MSFSGLNTESRVLAGVGALLLAALFLPWFETAPEANPYTSPAREVTLNAWQAFAVIDLVLALTAVAAVAVVLLAAREDREGPSTDRLAAVFAMGTLSVVLVIYRLYDPIENTVARYGTLVELVALVALLYAGREGGRLLAERFAATASGLGSSSHSRS